MAIVTITLIDIVDPANGEPAYAVSMESIPPPNEKLTQAQQGALMMLDLHDQANRVIAEHIGECAISQRNN